MSFCFQQLLAMKEFTLRVGVVSLRLKVKFSCSISLCAKYHTSQHYIIEQKPLTDGQLSSPIQEYVGLEAECNKQSGEISQTEKVAFLLYLHSTHGKLLIGSYTYKLADFTQRRTYPEKIRNSPDKEASIVFDIEADFTTPKSHEPIKQTTSPIPSDLDGKPSAFEANNDRGERVRTYTGSYSPNPLIPKSPKPPLQPKTNLYKSNASSLRQNSPKNALLRSNISSEGRIKDRGVRGEKGDMVEEQNKIETLRRRVNQMRVNSPEHNQKYLEKIMALEKQQKANKEKINRLDLQLKISANNTKFQEREVSAKKAKIDSLEGQLRDSESKNSHLQQRIRQQQYRIKSLLEQNNNLSQTISSHLKKLDKKEEHYKEQMSQANKKLIELEKQKDTMKFTLKSMGNQLEQASRKHQELLKEKDKKMNQQRTTLNKKIAALEIELQQSKHSNTGLSASINLLQKQNQELESDLQRAKSYLEKIKNQKQQLSLQISRHEINQSAIEAELRELKQLNVENELLKAKIEEKDQEIEMLRQKNLYAEEELSEAENKLRMLTINNEGLEHEYEQLYYDKVGEAQEIERKKKMIAELIQQNETMSKSIEKLHLQIQRLQIQSHELKTELQQNIQELQDDLDKNNSAFKKTKNQLLEEAENRKKAEKHLQDLKKALQEAQASIQQLSIQKQQTDHQSHQLNAANQLLENRIRLLGDEFEDLKRQKEEIQDKMKRNIEEMQMQITHKKDEIENLQGKATQLKAQVQQLERQLQNLTLQLQIKNKQIAQLNHELQLINLETEQLGMVKSTLEQNNSSYQGNIIELNQKIENLQLSLKQLQKNIEDVDMSLRPIKQDISGQENIHQLRIKKVKDLYTTIEEKDQKLEEAHLKIQRLQEYVKDLRIEADNLKEDLRVKCQQFDALQRSKKDVEDFIAKNLSHLQTKLQSQSLQLISMEIFKEANENLLNRKEQSISGLQKTLNDLNNRIKSLLRQKEEQSKKLDLCQKQIRNLQSQFKLQKEECQKAYLQIKQLLLKLEKADKKQQQQATQISKLMDKIEQLSKSNNALLSTIKQQKSINNTLQMENVGYKNRITNLSSELGKKEDSLKQSEAYTLELEQEMNKKLNLLKTQLSQKSKQLVVSENQRKSRIQILNQSIDQLRKENYDQQTLIFSEKNNQAKLNSIYTELNNYLPKIEKAHNIKAYYMMPIRQLLTKFEQILKISQKNYVDLEKKTEKRETGQSGSVSKLQRKLSLKKIPSQLK